MPVQGISVLVTMGVIMKVEITEAVKSVRQFSKDGVDYTFYSQPAHAHLMGVDGKTAKYPLAFELSLNEKDLPFAVGMYDVFETSLTVDKYKRLIYQNPVLVKAK